MLDVEPRTDAALLHSGLTDLLRHRSASGIDQVR